MRSLMPLLFLSLVFFLPQALLLANAPLPVSVKEPVFLKVSGNRHHVEGKQRLNVNFSVDSKRCRAHYGSKTAYKACHRELHLKGRRVLDGVSITPAIVGIWRWENDNSISFTPASYWRSGVSYKARFALDRMEVPPQVKLTGSATRQTTVKIVARPLTPKISHFTFMQDPDNPSHKRVTARLTTNYPVKRDSLTRRIRFSLEEVMGGTIKTRDDRWDFDINYSNQASTTAALSVELETLPDKDRFMWMHIAPGVVPLHGGKVSKSQSQERVRIPSVRTWLQIDEVATAIVRDTDDIPGQVVTLNLNVKADPETLLSKTRLYLLPARHPAQKVDEAQRYEWKGANEVSKEILKFAELLDVSVKNPHGLATQFALTYRAPPDRYVLLVIDEGLQAFGGYTLERRYREVMRVPDHPHDIEIMHRGSILPLSGERKLSLHARGTDRLEVKVAHIDPNALHHFISQTAGDIRAATFQNWRFAEENIADIQTIEIPMAYNNPQQSQYASFDFAPYVKGGRKGLFVLNIRGYQDKHVVGQMQRRFVLVSDLGLLVKQNADQTRPVFVVSFSTGEPMDGAEISVLARNGQVIYSANTDGEGMLTLPDFSGAAPEGVPVAIVAQQGKDYAFIPYERRDRALNYSRFNVGGNRPLAEGLNAFTFSDRGIYRPGETAHIGFILKNADWSTLPEKLPVSVIITDPRGNEVLNRLVTFDETGLKDVTLETGPTWLTGQYHAGLYLGHDNPHEVLLGATSFKVEEFQPDRLKITTGFLKDGQKIGKPKGWIKPDALAAKLSLQNLYGTAASERRATVRVRLNRASFQFAEFADYSFFDATPAPPGRVEFDLPEMQTDADGTALFPLRLDTQKSGSYAVSVELRGYEADSGRGVTAYDGLRVSVMDYAVGYRTPEAIHWLKKDSAAQVDIIAVNPNLERLSLENLRLTLVRKSYVSTLVKRNDGTYVYDSVPRYKDITDRPFTIASTGRSLILPTEEIGEFIYRLSDHNGQVVANIPFGVTGSGQRATGLDREAVLHLKADKEEYDPGSEIALQITAPYVGAGLITLESDYVIAHQWFRATQTDTVQTITIPGGFLGKGYINVAFVRDVTSREIYMGPLSYAVIPFIVTPDSRTVNIRLETDDKIKPGQFMDIRYRADKKGRAVIFAVDEGILQVAHYATPDPVDFFLLNRALQVETTQMLDLLMPEYSLVRQLSKTGGGMDDAMAVLQQQLNPFRRKSLAPAVFWSGIVDLDTTEKSLSWRVPGHFNGTLRLMAVAVSANAVGALEKKVTVRGDIVLAPNVPLTLAPGDEVEASMTIANAVKDSGSEAQFCLVLNPTAQLDVIKAPGARVTVPEGTEKTVFFRLRATNKLGAAHLNLTATTGDIKQSAKATLSVRPPVVRSTRMLAGYAEDGTVQISLPSDFYPTLATRELSFSALPSAYISGLAKYLDGFPYGCTEQLISRNFPKLSLHGLPEFGVQAADMQHGVESTIAMLRRRFTRDDGFSQWYGQADADQFITIYATDFLSTARESGIAVPEALLGKALRHIREYVDTHVRDRQDARSKAYGIYMLTRNGIVTSNEILHLLTYLDKRQAKTWPTDLIAAYLAASYDLLQQKNLAQETLKPFIGALRADDMSYKSAGWTDWKDPYYNPFIKVARGISLLADQFPNTLKELDPSLVFTLAAFVREQRYNTLSAAIGIQALRDYMDVAGQTLADAQWSVLVDGNALELPKKGTATRTTRIPMTANDLTVHVKPEGSFFYTLTQSGFLKNLPKKAIANGMEISRQFVTADGKPLHGPVKIGDVIEAVITARAYGDRPLRNVALVDLLPGGFELERESVGKRSTLITDFTDQREDRVIAFATVPTTSREFRYRIRAVNRGVFSVPPPYAESMYDLSIQAMGHGSQIKVIAAAE